MSDQAQTLRKAKARLRRNEGLRSEVVLEAALELFSEEGYSEVTMQKIADRVGIRHSLIYYYFESKEKLFHSALLHALEKLLAAYDEVKARHEDPVSIINEWFKLNVDQERFLKGLIKIMIDHVINDRKRPPRFVDEIVRNFYQFEQGMLAESIRDGVARGVFTCDEPEDMAAFISRNIDGIYYGEIVRRDASMAASMEKLKQLTWRLLEYTPEKSPKPKKRVKRG